MTLRWSLVTKGLRPHGQLKQKLQQKVRKLEKHLAHFPPDAVHLQVNLEKHPRKPVFAAGLTLRLPSNMLRAEKMAADPIPAFDQATKALLREIAMLKSSLRHESEWKRTVRQDFPPTRVANIPVGAETA
jgi:ribosome-associated translation inhibitor RaiA